LVCPILEVDAGAGRETFDDACGWRHGRHILDGRRRLGHPDDLAHTAIVADPLATLEQVVGEDYLIPCAEPVLAEVEIEVLCALPAAASPAPVICSRYPRTRRTPP